MSPKRRKKIMQERRLQHFAQRAKERFDIDITSGMRTKIVKSIQGKETHKDVQVQFLEKSTNSRSIWLVILNGNQAMRVVYSSAQKAIFTALPLPVRGYTGPMIVNESDYQPEKGEQNVLSV